MISNEIIHVALCFSDTNGEYSRYVLAVIAQAISRTKNPIMFHLVHNQTLQTGGLCAGAEKVWMTSNMGEQSNEIRCRYSQL